MSINPGLPPQVHNHSQDLHSEVLKGLKLKKKQTQQNDFSQKSQEMGSQSNFNKRRKRLSEIKV